MITTSNTIKHFIDFQTDVSLSDLEKLLDTAATLKQQRNAKIFPPHLAHQSLGMIFTKSSTRTRVAFEVGMYELGGQALFLSHQDIQLGRGETIHDTAKVLSRMLHGIMIRTFSHDDVLELARHSTIPIINGLTDEQHPTQALADLLTIKEHFGLLKGLKIAYIGDGNNVANSLLQACSKAGMHVALACPDEYHCPEIYIQQAKENGKITGSQIEITDDPIRAVKDAHVIYTDTWISMGQEEQKSAKMKIFANYQVNQKLMNQAASDSIFLHCLPAYADCEVSKDVLYSPASLVFDQAENRLHAHKSILVHYLNQN